MKIGNKEITGLYIGARALTAVYRGAVLIWEGISSCFGSGFWKGDRGWRGHDGWRGNGNK